MSGIIDKKGVDKLFSTIKELIENSKKDIAIKVNSIMTITYWNVGMFIKNEVLESQRAKYGDEIIKQLSRKLTYEYGTGFSRANLVRMARFYKFFNDKTIVATLSHQLSWSHFIEFIKIEDELKREFYTTMCKNENWSVRTLRKRVNSMLFERTAISKKPEDVIINDINLLSNEDKMTSSMFFRDPYFLDFLELKNNFSEKDLESAIIKELENFILEFGNDFAFMARQKRIQIGGNDYKIDLLFFHRKLRRLVVIELKLGDFKPEYKGQVELYLKWLSKYEKQDYEEEPIAIILCSGKDSEVVELMDLEKDNIHVSEYWLKLPPKEVLKSKLNQAVLLAKANIEVKGGEL